MIFLVNTPDKVAKCVSIMVTGDTKLQNERKTSELKTDHGHYMTPETYSLSNFKMKLLMKWQLNQVMHYFTEC